MKRVDGWQWVLGFLLIAGIIFLFNPSFSSEIRLSAPNSPIYQDKMITTKTIGDLWDFDQNSYNTELSKKSFFEKEYQGKYANWEGMVRSVSTDLKLELDLRRYSYQPLIVSIQMNPSEYDKLKDLISGQSVKFQARILSYSLNGGTLQINMEDGTIIQ